MSDAKNDSKSGFLEENHRSDLEAQCVAESGESASSNNPEASEDTTTDGDQVPRADKSPRPQRPVEPPQPRRRIMEIIHDPRSIQCLPGLGGFRRHDLLNRIVHERDNIHKKSGSTSH